MHQSKISLENPKRLKTWLADSFSHLSSTQLLAVDLAVAISYKFLVAFFTCIEASLEQSIQTAAKNHSEW